MHLLAIDPGSAKSGYVELVNGQIRRHDILDNDYLLEIMHEFEAIECVIERPRPYVLKTKAGHPYVPSHVIGTTFYAGRLSQEWFGQRGYLPHLIDRVDVLKHVLGKGSHVGDKEIRAALVERFGGEDIVGRRAPKGKKITSHCWAALAVGVTFADTRKPQF